VSSDTTTIPVIVITWATNPNGHEWEGQVGHPRLKILEDAPHLFDERRRHRSDHQGHQRSNSSDAHEQRVFERPVHR
jgi:hypothetical protein